MFRCRFFFVALILASLGSLSAQSSLTKYHLEDLINRTLLDFPFSDQNKLRLAAYAELKGVYSSQDQALTLDYAGLGSLTIYPRSCVLKTADRRLYYLSKTRNSQSHIQAFNDRIDELLDRIYLFSNHGAPQDKVSFVDTYLAKKNIEPYEKIFLRHIFLKYGRYDRKYERVEFHTDWLPSQTYLHLSTQSKSLIRRPLRPLWIKLDKYILRGYYIRDKGTVFVEDVNRDVFYASGEEYASNISAFKKFLYKMLSQTTQFIIAYEKKRLEKDVAVEDLKVDSNYAYAYAQNSNSKLGQSRGASQPRKTQVIRTRTRHRSMYSENDWIPMMLGVLRSQKINIGDPDIIQYFIGEPYFDRLYKQLTPAERRRVDAFLRRR